MERPLALVVDEDPRTRAVIRDVFEEHEIAAVGAASRAEVDEALRRHAIRFLVVDSATPGVDALETIRYGASLRPQPIAVAILPAGQAERARELVAGGAFDVLTKPLDETRIDPVVRRMLRLHALAEEVQNLREELQGREGYQGLIGKSPSMERVRERLRQLAAADGPVWFWGEPGAGKELAARTLHAEMGGEAAGFHLIECRNATPQTWDARHGGPGGADARTLYLDDLPSLAPELQARVLSALGAGRRILASSVRAPGVEAERGRLSAELHRALARETVEVPPLRDRVDDIPLLARHFIGSICAINHLPPIRLTAECIERLAAYPWPENVRELRGAMEHAVILARDGKILPANLPERILRGRQHSPSRTATDASRRKFREAKREVVESFEQAYLCELMQRFGGNVTAASQEAGMLRSALQRLLRKYGLKSAEFRKRRSAGEADASRSPD